jgi:acyl-[acyl-carrier-protein]-phospholipid O-acyltransferase/long-chain-fatty-acid--[acyl-carrier-protein] ligase
MRFTSWVAVVLAGLITLCYYLGHFEIAFAMTFLMAVQSAFYGPAKYGYLKQLFGKERIGHANGVAQAAAIVGILFGTFAFSFLFESLYPADASTTRDSWET